MENRKKKTFWNKSNLTFTGILLGVVLVLFLTVAIIMAPLNNWLINFEAAQPTSKSQQIFDQYFANANWAQLYKTSGEENTVFEDENAYASYMTVVTADKTLSFIETSAGTSGDHKYVVKAGDDPIAVFTLTADNKDAQVPDWHLGTMELVYQRSEFCNILTLPGNTVTVNGVQLDDNYLAKTVATKAENFLPTNVHGYQALVYRVDNLLTTPAVTVTTPEGETVQMVYDSTAKTYYEPTSELTISDDEKTAVVSASQMYAKYMILRATETGLKQYFDPSSSFYYTITHIDKWMQKNNGYRFGDATVTDYYRYSDTLYSAYIDMSVFVTCKDNTVKDYHLSSTLFMEKQNGKWICINMTNGNVQEEVVRVKLTYMDGEKVIHTEMVDAHAKKLTLPTVTAPEGMVLDGWYVKGINAQGQPTLDLAFKASETGEVTLPGDPALEPMVLYARFVAKEA